MAAASSKGRKKRKVLDESCQGLAGSRVSPVPFFLSSDTTVACKKMGGHPIQGGALCARKVFPPTSSEDDEKQASLSMSDDDETSLFGSRPTKAEGQATTAEATGLPRVRQQINGRWKRVYVGEKFVTSKLSEQEMRFYFGAWYADGNVYSGGMDSEDSEPEPVHDPPYPGTKYYFSDCPDDTEELALGKLKLMGLAARAARDSIIGALGAERMAFESFSPKT